MMVKEENEKIEKSKTLRYCVIHYCVVQSTCSYIILTLQTNRRLHTLLMTRQMGMLRRKRKLEFQLGDIKIWENNGVLKILKSKTSVGSANKEKNLQSDTLRWMDTFWPRKRTHEQHRTAWKTQKAQAWTILNWLQNGVKASWWESFEKLLLPSGFCFYYYSFLWNHRAHFCPQKSLLLVWLKAHRKKKNTSIKRYEK